MPPELLDIAKGGSVAGLALAGLWFVARQLKSQYEERIKNYKELVERFEAREEKSLERERALYERMVGDYEE